MRWQHPRRGLLWPSPHRAGRRAVAAGSRLHPAGAGHGVCRRCRRCARLTRIRPTMAVNLSARNLMDARLIDDVMAILERHELPPSQADSRDHRDRDRQRARGRRAGPDRPAGTGGAALGRRFRYRLLVAVVPAAVRGQRDQGRPPLRRRASPPTPATRRSCGPPSTSPPGSACGSSPRASRTTSSCAACASTAAIWARDICSDGRCPFELLGAWSKRRQCDLVAGTHTGCRFRRLRGHGGTTPTSPGHPARGDEVGSPS